MKLAIFAHPEVEGILFHDRLLYGASELVVGEGLPLEGALRRCAAERNISLRIVPARADRDAQREEMLESASCALVICAHGDYMDVPGARRAWALGMPIAFRNADEFTRA